MKTQINLIIYLFMCLFMINKADAQDINFSGPIGTVPSGSIVTFSATGETANKYIGSVSRSGDPNYYVVTPGVTCPLWETNYFEDNRQGGKFKYQLINENTTAKTVNLAFTVLIVSKNANGSFSYNNQVISYTVTIGPGQPPNVPWITDVNNSIKYGNDWSSLIKWDSKLVNTPTVTFEVYQNGVYKGTVVSNTPNDGEERMDWTPYATMGGDVDPHWFGHIQLKIISDANPAVFSLTPEFKMQID